ncbi:MAG: hypothetical protein WED04_09920 [Promethearchaeati archaeon SRVP18_Atabeyarchaeia-1]
MPQDNEDAASAPGLGWRVSVTVAVSLGWLVFLILWLAFLSVGWPLYQSIAIVLISILLLVVILSLMWVPWGLKYGRKYMKEE